MAVKTISKNLLRAGDIAALRREVEILHHLKGHPHISELLGVFEVRPGPACPPAGAGKVEEPGSRVRTVCRARPCIRLPAAARLGSIAIRTQAVLRLAPHAFPAYSPCAPLSLSSHLQEPTQLHLVLEMYKVGGWASVGWSVRRRVHLGCGWGQAGAASGA